MASYVPWFSKKRTRQHRREKKLAGSIRDGESHETQLQLAEDVRLARIRAVQSDRALVMPTDANAPERLQKFDDQIAALEQTTANQILNDFVERERRISLSQHPKAAH